jgi:hypothetical protein
MDETKQRSQRMRRVIKFCGVRLKALHTGNKRINRRANSLTLKKEIKAAREREEHEREAYIGSLRQLLSPREVAEVREREKRERELYTPKKRPRARHRRPTPGPHSWRPGPE